MTNTKGIAIIGELKKTKSQISWRTDHNDFKQSL